MNNKTLTPKQQRFCLEYIKDCNATASAVRAGYSAKTAMEQGYQLLQKTSVHEEIKRLQCEVSEATGVQVKQLVQELSKVAFASMPDLLNPKTMEVKDLSELTEAQRACIQEISSTDGKVKVRLHPKLTAIDMLMKHLGGYVSASDLIDKLPPERLDALVEEILQKLKK